MGVGYREQWVSETVGTRSEDTGGVCIPTFDTIIYSLKVWKHVA